MQSDAMLRRLKRYVIFERALIGLHLVVDDQNRAGGCVDDMFGNGADNKIHDIIPTIGADDNQICSELFGHLHDGIFRLAAVKQVIYLDIIGM